MLNNIPGLLTACFASPGYKIMAKVMRAVMGVLPALLLLAAIPRSGVAQDEYQISVNPNVLRPVNGKLPPSLNAAVYLQTCKAGTNLADGHHALWATGGLTPTNSKFGPCSATSTLTIDPSLPAGNYDIILLKDDQPVGHAALTVLDAAAGALPPGLAPQVDVLWTIMSEKVCGDVFGTRVGKRFYCIEVKIGNNSGHALQIAGLGFDNKSVFGKEVKQANSSYVSTRAVLQREETLSLRNYAYHGLAAAGLLMASFTPYFSNPVAKSHFSTASSIATGALLQAFDIIVPDRVPGQLSNLDDESLRDGSVIPNNSQVRTTVFVEKRALTEALKQAAYDTQKAMDAAIDSTMFTGIPGTTIMKSEERGLIHRMSESPYLIRRALGDLVLVGDPIEYLPRVQIESSSSQPSSSVVLGATSLSFTNTQTEQKLTLTNAGTGPLALNSVTVTGTGADADDFKVTANTCGSTVAAGANCTITVTFTPPITAATQTATLSISDSASGSPQTVSLTGTEPAAVLSQTSLAFPNLSLGRPSSEQKVILTNSGTAPLVISAISFVGANGGLFSLDKTAADACGLTLPLAPQASCGISIIATPSAAGNFSATLNVTDNAIGSPQTVSLSGNAH